MSLFVLAERALGNKSQWAPYIRVLPKSFDTPVNLDISVLELLAGSPVKAMAERDIANIRQEFSRVFNNVMKGHESLWPSVTFTDYAWARTVVDSRAWTLRGIKYLVPLADMLNYRAGANDQDDFQKRHRVVDSGSSIGGHVQLLADRSWSSGEQVFESYGDNPNSMYFRFFGFVV